MGKAVLHVARQTDTLKQASDNAPALAGVRSDLHVPHEITAEGEATLRDMT